MSLILTTLALALVTFLLYKSSKAEKDSLRCNKESSKICPIKVSYRKYGRGYSGHIRYCCKTIDKMKEINKIVSKLEPNKDYNGIKFTKSAIESAKRHSE